MTRTRYWDGDTFERHGRTFRVEFPYADTGETPWERDDGHGAVSDWRRVDSCTGRPVKAPGERVLCRDRGSFRTYDYAGAVELAARDGWGLAFEEQKKLAARLGRQPTRREIQVAAVERDFEYLRRWCNDDWCYVGVVVKDVESGESASLWGIESDAYDYLAEVAHELSDEMADRNDWTDDKRRERAEWAARDVMTEAA